MCLSPWLLITAVSVSYHIYSPEFLMFMSGFCLYFAQAGLVFFHVSNVIFILFCDYFLMVLQVF